MNLYPHFKQVALDSGNADNVDMNTDTLKLLFLNGYTYDSADQYVSDVLAGPGATEIARSSALTSPTVTNGTFDAADGTVAAVSGANPITDVVLFKDTGLDTTAVVIAHIDEDQAAAALSLNLNGSDVNFTFDAAGIFDL